VTLGTDDREAIARIARRDPAGLEVVYDRYATMVFSLALRIVRDTGDAEDVTQEVFVTVFQALGSFRGGSSLLVWIFGITRNKVNRRFRGPRPRLEPLEAEGTENLAIEGVGADRAVDARRILDRCVDVIEHELTPLQRRIFHLKHLRRQSIQAIATALGKSEDAIKANLYRMRRALAAGAPGLEAFLGR
jgi:RNA polymerase sigma-70 factor (ECF subfamily)